MDGDQRFWAFISYSHADAAWAEWLHRALESYVVPRRLVGRPTAAGPAPRRFRPIFRDRGDLAANPDLRETIAEVLESTGFLIVVCSPAAARSPWVEDEIVQFKRQHGEDRILSVIVGGDPNASSVTGREADECFPRALRFHLDAGGAIGQAPAEPVAADLRPHGDGRRGALLKLLAGMLDVGLDELVRRDAQRRAAQARVIAVGSLAATLVMGALTAVALTERDRARAQQTQAEGLIEFMLGDLKDKLEPAGRLDALDAVGQKAMAYYAAQKAGDLDADSLGRRARVLHLMGDVREKRGDFAGALGLFQQASQSTAELLARRPDDPQRIFDHAQSVYWVGSVAEHRGDLAEAEAAFTAYQQLATRLISLDPRNQAWRAELAYADTALGDVLLKERRATDAARAFTEALSVFEARAAAAPADRDHQFDAAQGHSYLADADYALGRLDDSLRERLAERTIYQSILAASPDYRYAAYSMTVNRRKAAAAYLAQGQLAPAVAELTAESAGIDKLIEAEPATVDYRGVACSIYVLLARALLAEGRFDAARAAADRALTLAEGLVRQDPTGAESQGLRLGSARVVAIEIAAARARSAAERGLALAPAVAEAKRLDALADARAYDWQDAGLAAEADLLAGDAETLAGHAGAARAAWSTGVRRLGAGGSAVADPLDPDTHSVMVKLQSRLKAWQSAARREP